MQLIILILASLRLTYLFTSESGPLDIFTKIRNYFGLIDIIDADGSNTQYIMADESNNKLYTMIQGILSCPMCCSLWMALIVVFIQMIGKQNDTQ